MQKFDSGKVLEYILEIWSFWLQACFYVTMKYIEAGLEAVQQARDELLMRWLLKAFLQALQRFQRLQYHPSKCSMLHAQCFMLNALRPSWLWSGTSSWQTRTTATSTSSSVSRSGNCSTAAGPNPKSSFFSDRARLLLMDNDPKFALKDIEKVLLHKLILLLFGDPYFPRYL